MNIHEDYMKRAVELAMLGCGTTSPNPMVGCVIVKDGRIIGEGYHHKCGEFHAERNALLNCSEDPAGADLYVTLEPCCHQGKTPPCTDIIIEKQIAHVYIGSMDPNPKVAGKGAEILKEHGIEVTTGILEDECIRMNEVFFHYITTRTPFVAMKFAMTLDGKIASASGDSRWITGESARENVHKLRHRYAGIIVGIGTVLADDPMLNCRLHGGIDPVRIVCDSALRIPEDSRIVKTAHEIRTIVAISDRAFRSPDDASQSFDPSDKIHRLQDAGIELIRTHGDKVDLAELMKELGAREIDGILLESGAALNASMLEAGLVNKVYAYIAGKIVGGEDAKTPVGGKGIHLMSNAIGLRDMGVSMIGEDILVTGYPKY